MCATLQKDVGVHRKGWGLIPSLLSLFDCYLKENLSHVILPIKNQDPNAGVKAC